MKLYFDSQVDKDNEKIAKVLSEALNSHQLHNDENEEETCEELFIATVDGVPVAYSADSVTFSREYGYLVTTCALFSAVWHTIKHQTKQNGQLCIGTDHVAMYFMQFGYLLGVYKVNKPIPYDRIEISLRLIWTAFLFFFTPNISLVSNLTVLSIVYKLFYVVFVAAKALFCLLFHPGKWCVSLLFERNSL